MKEKQYSTLCDLYVLDSFKESFKMNDSFMNHPLAKTFKAVCWDVF